jgi:hypothetical protein
MLSIDYKQALDCIDRYQLQRSLESYGVPYKLISLIKMTSQTCSKVMVGNHASRSFLVGIGVRLGDALSTTPFNLALHGAIQDIQIQGTVVNQMTQLLWLCRQHCSYES